MHGTPPSELAQIEADVWAEIARAAADKAHPWRTAVLATIHGDMADARTIILREVDPRQRKLLCYSDERANKVSQLLQHPNGTLVMWSPALGWQLRCRVRLALEMSGLAASSRWARIRLAPAAQDYLSPLPPGSVLTHAPEPAVRDVPAVPNVQAISDQAAPSPVEHAYFSVIEMQVVEIDWLDLNQPGHRRALLCGARSHWLQP